jgi:transposase-like protein
MPRHGRLTQELIDGLTARIRAGNSIQASCDSLGVNDSLVRKWRARGQAEVDRLEAEPDASPLTTEYLYRAISAGVTAAMADAEAGRIVRILEAGRPHEIVTTVETTKHLKLRLYDDQNRPYDDVQTFTDVRREVRIDFDWRADAWWLEHARPAFWGRVQLDVSVTDERAPEVEADINERTNVLLDELRQRRAIRDQASGE